MALKDDSDDDFACREAKMISDFACLLSCGLCVSEANGSFQVLGDSSERLCDMMAATATTATTAAEAGDIVDCTSWCRIPSLQLKQKNGFSCPNSSNKTLMEQAAAANLSIPVTMQGQQELKKVPLSLLWNAQQTFLYLVDSRLKSTWDAFGRQLQQQQQQRGTGPSRTNIVRQVLQPSTQPIHLHSIVTSFRCALGYDASEPTTNNNKDGNNNNNWYVQPLMAGVVMDLKVLGQVVTVQLQAPGNIRGLFAQRAARDDEPLFFAAVEVVLDTAAVLKSMMQETRRLVRRAVSLAYQVAACMTHTLPRNAPGGILNNYPHQSMLSQLAASVLEPDKSSSNNKGMPAVDHHHHHIGVVVDKEKNRAASPSPSTLGLAVWLRHLDPIDSTTALEEAFSMPPPPARIPNRRDDYDDDDDESPSSSSSLLSKVCTKNIAAPSSWCNPPQGDSTTTEGCIFSAFLSSVSVKPEQLDAASSLPLLKQPRPRDETEETSNGLPSKRARNEGS